MGVCCSNFVTFISYLYMAQAHSSKPLATLSINGLKVGSTLSDNRLVMMALAQFHYCNGSTQRQFNSGGPSRKGHSIFPAQFSNLDLHHLRWHNYSRKFVVPVKNFKLLLPLVRICDPEDNANL